jgi:gluconate kinase
MPGNNRAEALLIGGRSGVGKSTVGWEVSAQLQAVQVAHAFVEGDNLDQIYPAPDGDPTRSKITEANLAALWHNYATLGCSRLIYTNTVSVLESDLIARAMGGAPRIIMVLLTAEDATALQRLSGREIGSQLGPHLARSAKMADYLESTAPAPVMRIPTDGRTVTDIAHDLIAATGWATQFTRGADPDQRLERQSAEPRKSHQS